MTGASLPSGMPEPLGKCDQYSRLHREQSDCFNWQPASPLSPTTPAPRTWHCYVCPFTTEDDEAALNHCVGSHSTYTPARSRPAAPQGGEPIAAFAAYTLLVSHLYPRLQTGEANRLRDAAARVYTALASPPAGDEAIHESTEFSLSHARAHVASVFRHRASGGAPEIAPLTEETSKRLATDAEILNSFDARDWAREFVKHAKARPATATDESTMLAWFASALMRGYDERESRTPEYQASIGAALAAHPAEAPGGDYREITKCDHALHEACAKCSCSKCGQRAVTASINGVEITLPIHALAATTEVKDG